MRSRMMLAAALSALLAGTAAAANNERWADVRDDAGTAADITDVSATSDDAGTIVLRVALANRVVLDAEDEIDVGIDVDRQPGTGWNGIDYVIGVWHGSEPFALAWSETEEDWLDVSLPTYRYAWEAGTATFTIDRSNLGWTNGFDFFVGSWDSAAASPVDFAPSDDDRWTYSLHLPFALRVAPVPSLDLTDKAARAGKTFTLAVRVVREDTGATLHSGKVTCTGTAGGKRLKPSRRPRFFRISMSDGSGDFTQALCTWKVPASAKGKLLKASTTVSLLGKSATRTFAGTVR